jgi:hypothetical protein
VETFPRERIDRIAGMLRQCKSHDVISATLSKEWGLSYRRIRDYIREVYRQWREAEPDHADQSRQRAKESWRQFFEDAKEAGEWATAAVALDRLTKVEGAYAPDKQVVQHEGAIGVVSTDPEKIRARVLELLQGTTLALPKKGGT